jgi:hypothetical protein
VGQTLDSFLAPQSAHALHTMLTRLKDEVPTAIDALQLGTGRSVHASINRDPDGRNFLVAFANVAEHEGNATD